MNETIIGLTIVAFGASLPEIFTAVVAAVRRYVDVALGNVLGSCVFNLLAITRTLAVITPVSVPAENLQFNNLIMLSLAVTLFRQIGPSLGAVFPGRYAV